MQITKCDTCGAEISGSILDRASIQVRVGALGGVAELCKPCATPVVRFLEQSQLLEDQLEKLGFLKRTTSPPLASSGTPAKTSQDQRA
jgi:hypothetical protein